MKDPKTAYDPIYPSMFTTHLVLITVPSQQQVFLIIVETNDLVYHKNNSPTTLHGKAGFPCFQHPPAPRCDKDSITSEAAKEHKRWHGTEA